MRLLWFFGTSFFILAAGGCKPQAIEPAPIPVPPLDSIYNPPLRGNFTLCYQKLVAGRWNVVVSGAASRNISQASGSSETGDDAYPQWSPDGRYIAFQRSAASYGPSVHVFDLMTGTDTCVTTDGALVTSFPLWTRDGHLCVSYQRPFGTQTATYLMKPDGSDKRRILDVASQALYFYDDSYRFVYFDDGSSTWYETDLDQSHQVPVFRATSASGKPLTVGDFNGATGDFLLVTNTISGVNGYALAVYSVASKSVSLLLPPENGLEISRCRYSPDYGKIVFFEKASNGSYLTVLSSSGRERLVALPIGNPWTYFGSDPIQFSWNGRYLAFTEWVVQGAGWIGFDYHLYIVDVVTRAVQRVDDGIQPSWSPTP